MGLETWMNFFLDPWRRRRPDTRSDHGGTLLVVPQMLKDDGRSQLIRNDQPINARVKDPTTDPILQMPGT